MSGAPTYIGGEIVNRILAEKCTELVTLMEKAFESYSNGNVTQPLRAIVPVPKNNGRMLTMPAYEKNSESLAVKVVTLFPENKTKSIPVIQGVVLLYDSCNGTLKAILDGQVLTKMRTAAASMAATKYLASKSIQIMAILGAGAQARSHYQIMKRFYNFKKIFVWNINEKSGRKLVEEINNDGQAAQFCSTVKEAVKEADIINVVTMATKPILLKEWVKEGAHINGVGAPFPEWQELDEDLMRSSTIYVDSRDGAFEESGDIIKSGADVYCEIGEMIAGKKEAFREKTTIFKSLGMAVQDVVTAEFVYQNYCK